MEVTNLLHKCINLIQSILTGVVWKICGCQNQSPVLTQQYVENELSYGAQWCGLENLGMPKAIPSIESVICPE